MLKSQLVKKIEQEISVAMAKQLKDCTGRGPTNVEVFLQEQFLVIKLEGYFLPAEITTAQTEQGFFDVKLNRYKWAMAHKQQYYDLIETVLGRKITHVYCDGDPITNSGVAVVFFDSN